jgi:SPX domain protein involved in polyphosphate accumulation
MAALPLREILGQLTSQEMGFFNYIDAQLEKVESFYSSREKELVCRTRLLQEQLRELQDHRKLVHVCPLRLP